METIIKIFKFTKEIIEKLYQPTVEKLVKFFKFAEEIVQKFY